MKQSLFFILIAVGLITSCAAQSAVDSTVVGKWLDGREYLKSEYTIVSVDASVYLFNKLPDGAMLKQQLDVEKLAAGLTRYHIAYAGDRTGLFLETTASGEMSIHGPDGLITECTILDPE